MAKRARTASLPATAEESTDLQSDTASVSEKISEFADDLSELLGRAREKAEGWIGQRQQVSAHLAEIRDTASELLSKLGGLTGARDGGADRRNPAAPRRAGRAAAGSESVAAAMPRKRLMSPEARKAISDAQKARWARHRRARKAGRQS